ncbi:Uncharacterised protein [Moraxella equi]|uniref:Uncharacterized protein n=1 Tax=Moraxella equi TaxID=60442 RepID=A0A378UTZ4_9GAMM|nr:Uncharacterised protein [Moraxella equi]STZ82973.1 Uncharacterised protein [Moraxella equi]STZ82986.1 Uncharacterised protein [Moraxella equi]
MNKVIYIVPNITVSSNCNHIVNHYYHSSCGNNIVSEFLTTFMLSMLMKILELYIF